MFKKQRNEGRDAGSKDRSLSPRPQTGPQINVQEPSSSSSRVRPPNVLNVTSKVGAEANTIGAARRVTPVILGKANQSDAGGDYRPRSSEKPPSQKPERTAPLHSAPLHIVDEHSHFASILSRRMERYICDVGDDCVVDTSMTARFGEARSARTSVLSTRSEMDALAVPNAFGPNAFGQYGNAPWPSPRDSRRDTRIGSNIGNETQAMGQVNSDIFNPSAPSSSLLLGAGSASGAKSANGQSPASKSVGPSDQAAEDDNSSAGSTVSRPKTVPSSSRGGGMAESSSRRDRTFQPKPVMSPAAAAMILSEQRRPRRASRDMREMPKPSQAGRRGMPSRGRGEESCLEALAAIEKRTDH